MICTRSSLQIWGTIPVLQGFFFSHNFGLKKKSFFLDCAFWENPFRGDSRLLLDTLAARERQADGVLLCQGGQLFEELTENDGAVHGVLHPQRLGLLLQAGGPAPAGATAAPEQRAVQRMAAVPDVREGQLGGVPGPGRAVGVAEDQVSKRRLAALDWNWKCVNEL